MKLASTIATSTLALTLALALSGSLLTGCASDPEETGDTTTTTTDTNDTSAPAALTGKDLAGHWVSEGCESYPDGKGGENHLTRDFTLTEKGWDLTFTLFGDAGCSYPLFSARIQGPYSLGEVSAKVDGATEGTFGFESIEWTALDQGMADLFTQSGCGAGAWEVGAPQDVTGTGCIGVAHPVSECPEEYDVVAIEGDALYFGERVTDMCKVEGRPAALNPYAVVEK